MRRCNACGHNRPDDLMAVAAPTGSGWYCKDTAACKARRNPTEKEQKMTLPQHSRFASWAPAAASEGDVYLPREHYGHHAIVKVISYKAKVITANSPEGAPAVIVDVYDMKKKAVFRDVLMMTGSIVDTFKDHAGGAPLVVQWERKVAKNGRDYAAPAPAIPEAVEAAEALYAKGDPFAPTRGIIEEEAPF